MDKKSFDRLPKEHQWIIVKEYLDMFQSTIRSRMALLPLMSGLAATLLVIATFNPNLISLDNLVRFLVSVLLLLIPIPLYLYNDDLKKASTRNKTSLDELTGEADLSEQSLLSKASSWAPDIAIWVLMLVVLILIFKMWHVDFLVLYRHALSSSRTH